MQSIIGNSLVAKLKPSDKPYEVRDLRLKGLLLRVQPSGVMAYYVEYGRGKRIHLGRADAVTPSQARVAAKGILGDAYRGKDPTALRREAKAHTLESFIDEAYAPWARENLRTATGTIGRLKSSFPDLQSKKLTEITPWLVEKWRMARLKSGTKASTVNRDLADLKSSLAKAVAWGLLESHPLAGLKRSKVDRSPSVRFLSADEEGRLRSALDAREDRLRRERDSANTWRRERDYPLLPSLARLAFADHLKPMVLLSLNTGLRRGELFGLTWHDIDLEQAILTIPGGRAKSGRTRDIPLNSEAIEVFHGWHGRDVDPAGIVFPAKGGGPFNNVRRAWLGVLRKAKIARFRWHDIRHTFASKLVMAGVDLNTVRELLGHADYQMTLRYAHLAPEHKAAAVARLVGANPAPTARLLSISEAKASAVVKTRRKDSSDDAEDFQ
ncbi:MAG: site-specific integrase [Proteobacteria bacterium]|nr:site-specific integrase [Pseudomonadota bacterium]